MPNLMQAGATWLGGKLKSAAGRSVTLVRAGHADAPLTGAVAMQDYEVVSEDGFSTLVRSYDWTFVTADLPYELRKGDLLLETLDGDEIRFELMPISKEPAARWLDTSGILTLAHSKKVG